MLVCNAEGNCKADLERLRGPSAREQRRQNGGEEDDQEIDSAHLLVAVAQHSQAIVYHPRERMSRAHDKKQLPVVLAPLRLLRGSLRPRGSSVASVCAAATARALELGGGSERDQAGARFGWIRPSEATAAGAPSAE